jgi:hypothetical protein
MVLAARLAAAVAVSVSRAVSVGPVLRLEVQAALSQSPQELVVTISPPTLVAQEEGSLSPWVQEVLAALLPGLAVLSN